jgi:protein-tyrosine phosphatase
VGGNIESNDQLLWLRGLRVTHIICVAAELNEADLCTTHGFGFYQVPWPDDGKHKASQDFLDALAWVEAEAAALTRKRRKAHFFVHCFAGAYRSPLLATFLLAMCEGLSADDAYALLRERREHVSAFKEPAYRASCLAALAAARADQ